jgi:hypothetical protein
MFYVNWKFKEEAEEQNPNTNSVIAAYTTTWARIRLYKILSKLGNAVIYYDTDSVMFLHEPGNYMPPTGDFLGDLKDEALEFGVNSKITEFVSCGPKCYSFRVAINGDVNNIKTITKVKGFQLNHSSEEKINFNSLLQQVRGEIKESVIIDPKKICRMPDHTVVSRKEMKKQRLVYNKRWIVGDYFTLPFGYKE